MAVYVDSTSSVDACSVHADGFRDDRGGAARVQRQAARHTAAGPAIPAVARYGERTAAGFRCAAADERAAGAAALSRWQARQNCRRLEGPPRGNLAALP